MTMMVVMMWVNLYRVAQRIWHTFLRLKTLSNIGQFSNFFHHQNQEKSC